MTPRVGLIGARRSRRGLGPFVARDLKAAGATVPCFLGTQSETVELAARELFESAAIEARGYTRLEEMLGREELHALVILSPAETHESYLSAASLEIDGQRAERKVSLPGYGIAFSDGGRTVRVADPLSARIRAFVADLEAVMNGAPPPEPTPVLDRMVMLEALLGVYSAQIGGSGR